jgi:hypothetical protein
MSDKINKALDLVPYTEKNLLVPVDANTNIEQAAGDVDYARTTLYDAVVKSQEAVEDMLVIARQSQHPKAYEVLNSAIKTMADVSMGLADLQLKKQRILSPKGGQGSGEEGQVVNNLFVGSTAELQKMLEDMKNNNG